MGMGGHLGLAGWGRKSVDFLVLGDQLVLEVTDL